MRIVFLGTFAMYPKGTISARALPLAQALTKRGHSVSVVIPPWDNPVDSGRELTIEGVKVANIKLPPRMPVLSHVIITLRLLLRSLAERPDVLHIFKPKAYAGLVAIGFWLLKRLGFSRVRLVVDSDDWEGKGGWNEMGCYPWWQQAIFAFQERWGLHHGQMITVASKALGEMARKLGVPPERILHLPNGVPERQTSSTRGCDSIRTHHQLGQGPVLLLYTRFFEFRRERLLEILNLLVDQFPNVRLLIVGKGLSGEEQTLKSLAASDGLLQCMRFTGWVESQRLEDYFAAADVALYPMEDTLLNRTKCPAKLVELLGAGVPVVADRVGEAAEYINSGETGILVEPGNSDEFVAAVVLLLKDDTLRRRLGAEAKERAWTKYSWDRLADIALRAYRQ
ncbi:MAG: glycosyltransferase family 4 protein [Chloroflexota bacterium]